VFYRYRHPFSAMRRKAERSVAGGGATTTTTTTKLEAYFEKEPLPRQ